jgi:hypothetical protein
LENQHRKISGYRELSQEEINLMNEVKALGVAQEAVLKKVEAHIAGQRTDCEMTSNMNTKQKIETRMDNATPERFLSLAKTEFQTGLMYATRAVAQPEFF